MTDYSCQEEADYWQEPHQEPSPEEEIDIARAKERAKVIEEVDRMIETHINHLYPMTFRAKLAPMDIEVLDQLEFIRVKLEEMKARE